MTVSMTIDHNQKESSNYYIHISLVWKFSKNHPFWLPFCFSVCLYVQTSLKGLSVQNSQMEMVMMVRHISETFGEWCRLTQWIVTGQIIGRGRKFFCTQHHPPFVGPMSNGPLAKKRVPRDCSTTAPPAWWISNQKFEPRGSRIKLLVLQRNCSEQA